MRTFWFHLKPLYRHSSQKPTTWTIDATLETTILCGLAQHVEEIEGASKKVAYSAFTVHYRYQHYQYVNQHLGHDVI